MSLLLQEGGVLKVVSLGDCGVAVVRRGEGAFFRAEVGSQQSAVGPAWACGLEIHTQGGAFVQLTERSRNNTAHLPQREWLPGFLCRAR